MGLKHDYDALLKYMHLLESGKTISFICRHYGICKKRLGKLWYNYQIAGVSSLLQTKYKKLTNEEKCKIVLDIEMNHLTLVQTSIKYGVSARRVQEWLRIYRTCGIETLLITKKRGRPPGMGRPKKVQKPETELERLRREVQELKTEVALLKKVKALVEEREARLRAIGQGQSEN